MFDSFWEHFCLLCPSSQSLCGRRDHNRIALRLSAAGTLCDFAIVHRDGLLTASKKRQSRDMTSLLLVVIGWTLHFVCCWMCNVMPCASPEPCEFIELGAVDVGKSYRFMRFAEIHGPSLVHH